MASDKHDSKRSGFGVPPKPAVPPKKLLLPDIYADNNWEPDLSLEERAPVDDEADGFNPYDTAVLYKS